MKHLLLCVLVVVAAIAVCSAITPTVDHLAPLLRFSESDNSSIASFVEFAAKYSKTYTSDREMVQRFAIFKRFVAKAKAMDEESHKLGSTARYGITKFSDLTQEEFSNGFLMKKMPKIPVEKFGPKYQLRENITSIPIGAPPSFDWRQEGKVTGVYNQGSCGSCWAFSATENHESRYALQHGPLNSMSVQQILDCDAPGQYGCNGGWPYQAWEYITAQGGQDTWGCYPYAGQVEGCRWNGGCNAGGVASWNWIYPHNEPGMLAWLVGNAPISICVDASQWSSYQGGVVLGSQCATQTDHCVLLTGYNMNYNPPFWNVRNSWGTDWGMSGYIALAYNQNTCDMAAYPGSCNT